MAVLIYAILIRSQVVSTASATISSEASINTAVELIESQSLSNLTNFTEANLPQISVFSRIFGSFGQAAGHVFHEALISIAPLFALFIIFQILLLKMTKRQVIRIIIGFIYAFIGLTISLSAAEVPGMFF